MVLRLHKTEVLFEQCLAFAEQLDRPAVLKELFAALDREEPKLIAMVKKPKKGLTRLPVLFERKLKKYFKRVEDTVTNIHQKLAPMRQRHMPPTTTVSTSSFQTSVQTPQTPEVQISKAEHRDLTTQTSFASLPRASPKESEKGAAEHEKHALHQESTFDSSGETTGDSGSDEIPFRGKDSLLYAPSPVSVFTEDSGPSTRGAGGVGHASKGLRFESNKTQQDVGFGSKKALGRRKLRDISNSKTGPVEEEGMISEIDEDERRERMQATASISILLCVCDFLEEDVSLEPYLTYECVEMIQSAGELLSKGWNEPLLLKKSFELFRLAALDGSVVAARCVGLFYKTGMSVRKDLQAAKKWFTLAAEGSGDAISCFMLGEMHEFPAAGAVVDVEQASLNYRKFLHKSSSGSGLMLSKLLEESGLKPYHHILQNISIT